MPFTELAQSFEVLDHEGIGSLLPTHERREHASPQVVLYTEMPTKEDVLQVHQPTEELEFAFQENEPKNDGEIEVVLGDLPGVDVLDEDKEKALNVADGETVSSNETLRVDDQADAK